MILLPGSRRLVGLFDELVLCADDLLARDLVVVLEHGEAVSIVPEVGGLREVEPGAAIVPATARQDQRVGVHLFDGALLLLRLHGAHQVMDDPELRTNRNPLQVRELHSTPPCREWPAPPAGSPGGRG